MDGCRADFREEFWLEESSNTLGPGISEAVSAPSLLKEARGPVGHPVNVEALVMGHTKLRLKRRENKKSYSVGLVFRGE